VTAPGAPTRTITVTQLGTIWHSDASWIGFWPGTINVHAQALNTLPERSDFQTHVTNARNTWSEALNIPIGTGTAANAQIRAFAGSRSAIVELHRGFQPNWEGLASREPLGVRTRVATINTSNGIRHVYRFSGQFRILAVVELRTTAWTGRDTELLRNLMIHELGHTLGFWGHPRQITANENDVMWFQNHTGYELSSNEIRHLAQIYESFR